MNNNHWNGYFARHYKSKFERSDIERAKNFIYGQLKILNHTSPLQANDVVLEIGCALGSFLELIKEHGVIDISAIELDESAAEYTRATQRCDVDNTTVMAYSRQKKFTKIYAFEVLEHLESPTQDIEKIYSLLKPGGYFIGSTPHPFKRNVVSDSSHLFVLHPSNWKRLFERAGFRVHLIQSISGLPFFYRYSPKFSVYLKFPVPILPLVSTTLFIAQKIET